MRILVTGGTGFVGAHTVVELVRRGHEPRLLVRDPARIGAALEPLGVAAPPFVLGDVTDPVTVDRAMRGCEAVLHAAAVYSLDLRKAGLMGHTNRAGTETVLKIAHAHHADPIVYVSSYAALFPPEGRTLTIRSPVKSPSGPYNRSKAAAERVARDFQARGAPVVISYPGGVFGPHDPHVGENTLIVRDILARRLPVIPPGGFCVVDVRDLAKAHAAMFASGRGARRYLLGGTGIALSALIDLLSEISGRNIVHVTLPAWALRPAIRLAGSVQRILPVRLPVTEEGFDTVVWNPRCDDRESMSELGFAPRDLRETFTDLCRWSLRVGLISSRQAGRLAITS